MFASALSFEVLYAIRSVRMRMFAARVEGNSRILHALSTAYVNIAQAKRGFCCRRVS